jgi:hypothetical protein
MVGAGVERSGRPPRRRVDRRHERHGQQPAAVRLPDQQDAVRLAVRVAQEEIAIPLGLLDVVAHDPVPCHLALVVLIEDQVGDDGSGHAPRLAAANAEIGLFARLICSASAALRESA